MHVACRDLTPYPDSNYLDLSYFYQANSNIDSIVNNKTGAFTQAYTYDSLSRLVKAKLPSVFPPDSQWFSYDKVGNRVSKNGEDYTYYTGTNRLQSDDITGFTYYYDDNGNMIKRESDGAVDSFAYDWNDRLIYCNLDDEAEVSFAYNASGLRVKKQYKEEEKGKDVGAKGFLFYDASEDIGISSASANSLYNKGCDIEKVYIKNDADYLTMTIVNTYLHNTPDKMDLFITLDLDTIANSGNISLPRDYLTKVPVKAAWEYCVYISDDDYGYYQKDGNKTSRPFGMAVQKVFGDSGSIQVKISKRLLNNAQAIRYTVATFDPGVSNSDQLWQGGSSAADVYPGTNATFGGEINGYGEITPLGILSVNDYTIYYVYDGINPVVEYSPEGSILARYIYAGGLHISKIAGADTHFYHCDALGSARVMTDENAAIQWQARYWPFGEMTESGFSDNTHGFTGKEWDDEMGLNYFCQRYYDPEVGRFLTLDPQDSPASSPYAYCANNPLKYTDLTGEAIDYHLKNEWYGVLFGARGSGYTGSDPGFGSWPGSMASWMRANPGFEQLVRYNEWQSEWRMYFQKNNYFRTTHRVGNVEITTMAFWNSITNKVGEISIAVQYSSEALTGMHGKGIGLNFDKRWSSMTEVDYNAKTYEEWEKGRELWLNMSQDERDKYVKDKTNAMFFGALGTALVGGSLGKGNPICYGVGAAVGWFMMNDVYDDIMGVRTHPHPPYRHPSRRWFHRNYPFK